MDNPQGTVEYKLSKARSQSSCCQFDSSIIYIFGGYNRLDGTLSLIERLNIHSKRMELLELKLPQPLRRFASIKISTTKILLLGGLMRMSKESDAVFCFDLEKEYTIEQLDKIDKAGIVDWPIILDQVGCLHLFIENQSGTAPLEHVQYSFLEYS
jgi:Galactose oxidase, central domain